MSKLARKNGIEVTEDDRKEGNVVERKDLKVVEKEIVRSSREADLYEREQVAKLLKSEQAARVERELRKPKYDAGWLFMDEGEMNGSVDEGGSF